MPAHTGHFLPLELKLALTSHFCQTSCTGKLITSFHPQNLDPGHLVTGDPQAYPSTPVPRILGTSNSIFQEYKTAGLSSHDIHPFSRSFIAQTENGLENTSTSIEA